jgi:hypothetical protein
MIAYHMLIKKDEYKDLGFDYLQIRSQERVERQLVNQLRSMGYAIEKMPVA